MDNAIIYESDTEYQITVLSRQMNGCSTSNFAKADRCH